MNQHNDIIDRQALKHFIAAAMDKYAPVDKSYALVTEEMIDNTITEMISRAIEVSREHQKKIIKFNNINAYMNKAKKGERIS